MTGTSLVLQWLRLHAPSAEGLGLIPGSGRYHIAWGMASLQPTQKSITKIKP